MVDTNNGDFLNSCNDLTLITRIFVSFYLIKIRNSLNVMSELWQQLWKLFLCLHPHVFLINSWDCGNDDLLKWRYGHSIPVFKYMDKPYWLQRSLTFPTGPKRPSRPAFLRELASLPAFLYPDVQESWVVFLQHLSLDLVLLSARNLSPHPHAGAIPTKKGEEEKYCLITHEHIWKTLKMYYRYNPEMFLLWLSWPYFSSS